MIEVNKEERQFDFETIFETTRCDEETGVQLFHKKYAKAIYSISFSICRCSYTAENVVDDVEARFLRETYLNRKISKPFGWLYKVTKNITLDEMRRNRPKRNVPMLIEPVSSENGVQDFIEQELFQWHLRNLSKKEQEYVVRKVLLDETFQEIATDKHLPISSVSSTYYRALDKIKANFEKNL